MRRFVPILLVPLVVAVTQASAARTVIAGFRTPSGNIGCVFTNDFGPTYLRCDIRSRLKPTPPKPKNCVDLEWGDSYELQLTGRAAITCHGDTAIDPRAPVLRYGKTWRRGGFTCKSLRIGLRCHNPRGHGFFMSKQHSYRF